MKLDMRIDQLALLIFFALVNVNSKAMAQDSTQVPVFSHLQFGTNYYAGFGANFGFQFSRLTISDHFFSSGLELCIKNLDTRNNPELAAIADSGEISFGMYLSLPLLYKVPYRFGIDVNGLTSYFIGGIIPSLGGPVDDGGVGIGEFVTGFELNAALGFGWMYHMLSFEIKAGIPLIDPFTRPKNPDGYRAHTVFTALIGFPMSY